MPHTCYGAISSERLAWISTYSSADITPERFTPPAMWSELRDVLLYHPDSDTRHEASFLIGDIPLYELMPWLFPVVKNPQTKVWGVPGFLSTSKILFAQTRYI